jgi:hypothetical protein
MKSAETMSVLELAIARTRVGVLPPQVMLWVLAASPVTVPTPDAGYNGEISSFRPLLVHVGGHDALVIFTDPHRMGHFAELAPQFIQLQGRDVMMMMSFAATTR